MLKSFNVLSYYIFAKINRTNKEIWRKQNGYWLALTTVEVVRFGPEEQSIIFYFSTPASLLVSL